MEFPWFHKLTMNVLVGYNHRMCCILSGSGMLRRPDGAADFLFHGVYCSVYKRVELF